MRIAWLVSILLAAPLAVLAQNKNSNDYREGYRSGYDDGFASGYRKGLDEASRGAPPAAAPPMAVPPPPRTGPITVSTAHYGTSARSCDATRWVARKVNGRRTASFEVTNDMCGDPAKGDRKELEITYFCGSIAKTASAYEHRTVSLDCTY
ncbi:MAG: hypothetical protein IPP91_19195 [Betaproteobacteria bacterium]|nr:hypothetical protein [Betaproteobacteria bacterium]